MDHYAAAINRDVGKVDTDANGLARYTFKLQLPAGIGHGNEPELSLLYCQGYPNGSLGVGWALGGLSTIRRTPASMGVDPDTPRPPDYDPRQPKLALDGAELLNIDGRYDAPGTTYTTEIDDLGKTVVSLGSGYLVRDGLGRQMHYGTTDDSRVWTADKAHIREWRLKKQVDCHGNAVTYSYVSSPGSASSGDVNACYLSEIRYTSNEKTGHPARRVIKCEYAPRTDMVVQTVQGDKAVWAHLLSAITIGVAHDEQIRIHRSYELGYSKSTTTGDSTLISIAETAGSGDSKVTLLPSRFGYTSVNANPKELFDTKQPILPLKGTADNVAMIPMNLSGRCLTDLACIRYTNSGALTVKTYLADRLSDGTVRWSASEGPGSTATLPLINHEDGFPSVLCPDLNGDGRSDLVIPCPSRDGNLQFSLSQSIGTGFQNFRTKQTPFKWTKDSKFMAMDLTGRGTTDIVQIFADGGKLAFRNFPAITDEGEIRLKDATITRTQYPNTDTIEWVPLTHVITGAKSLVRVWSKRQHNGANQLMATAFQAADPLDSSAGYQEGKTSVLGEAKHSSQLKYSVIPCDVNGDGVQDMVLATAEHTPVKLILRFSVYLGDGAGGFSLHIKESERELRGQGPLKTGDPGQFYITNLYGSNYPTLAYVYRERSSRVHICACVSGQSDGTLGQGVLYNIGGSIPSNSTEVVAADITGNGVGDWLFYTFDNDSPRVSPVYNQSKTTDLLAWAQNSMGLQTSLTYGSLSDPQVYTSSTDWRKPVIDTADGGRAVIAAPNQVVTALEHFNDPSINSLPFRVSLRKRYASARHHTRGRGWQGFATIDTTNMTESSRTTEHYLQAWPLTNVKHRVDTKVMTGELLRSESIRYSSTSMSKGSWKVYRANKTREQTDMWEAGVIARTSSIDYEYDDYGNILLQSPSEIHSGKLVHQAWQRSTYAVINGITGLMTSQKLSSKAENVNMSLFEDGDLSLTRLDYDENRTTVKNVSEWSTDVGKFSVRNFEFDDYGNEIRCVDAAGLVRTTDYDSVFRTLPVKITEAGPGILLTQRSAFDEGSGSKIAHLEASGFLSCYKLDGFGRAVESRLRITDHVGDSSQTALSFLSETLVTDPEFRSMLASCHLHPHRKLVFERHKRGSGLNYIGVKASVFSHAGEHGHSEIFEIFDCGRRVRKQYIRQGDEPSVTWMGWDYNSQDQQVFESFPVKIFSPVDLNWTPASFAGLRTWYDDLGRPKLMMRPAHGDQKTYIANSIHYQDGGATVREDISSTPEAQPALAYPLPLSSVQKRYIHIAGEDRVIESLDENGLRTVFRYDACGELIECTNPTGDVERRSYNANGSITMLDNCYMNSMTADKMAMRYEYNEANTLVRLTNAAGEIITFDRDAKGRPLQKASADGRTILYEYEGDHVKTVTVYARGTQSSFESRFEFSYDQQGRAKERKLTLGDGQNYPMSLAYNWQGELVQKTFPDGASTSYEDRGSRVYTTILRGGASTWSMTAAVVQQGAFEQPEKVSIHGTGMKEFVHGWKYDSQGFPLSHSLAIAENTLLQDHYIYNDRDQISRKHEFITGQTRDYKYEGSRLISSSSQSSSSTYSYSPAGNLQRKGGVDISYAPGQATGVRGGTNVFDISYDAVGRMKQRVTRDSSVKFDYDGFGSLRSWTDSISGISAEILTDFEGETIARKHSDGSSELFLSKDYTIHVASNGAKTVRQKLSSGDYVVGTVTNQYENESSTRPLGSKYRAATVCFTDTKGSLTHTFDGTNGDLRQHLEYDDYGAITNSSEPSESFDDPKIAYEGCSLESITGLLDFGARWYDPLVGRFTTPDDILDKELLIQPDGMNRYTFENNDPINHIDPTGHWSWSSILGVVLGSLLIVTAIAVTVATGGAAAPLAAAIVGALAASGVAGVIYSVEHHDEQDAAKFWAGFATTVAINAAIGAVTGALGAVATGARVASFAGNILGKVGVNLSGTALKVIGWIVATGFKAVVSGFGSVMSKATDRAVDNVIYGKQVDNVFSSAGSDFAKGFVAGAIFAAASRGGGVKTVIRRGTVRMVQGGLVLKHVKSYPGLTSTILKATAKPGGKIAMWGTEKSGLDKAALAEIHGAWKIIRMVQGL